MYFTFQLSNRSSYDHLIKGEEIKGIGKMVVIDQPTYEDAVTHAIEIGMGCSRCFKFLWCQPDEEGTTRPMSWAGYDFDEYDYSNGIFLHFAIGHFIRLVDPTL